MLENKLENSIGKIHLNVASTFLPWVIKVMDNFD